MSNGFINGAQEVFHPCFPCLQGYTMALQCFDPVEVRIIEDNANIFQREVQLLVEEYLLQA